MRGESICCPWERQECFIFTPPSESVRRQIPRISAGISHSCPKRWNESGILTSDFRAEISIHPVTVFCIRESHSGVRDIKVDGREAPIRAATVRERMPGTELANAPSEAEKKSVDRRKRLSHKAAGCLSAMVGTACGRIFSQLLTVAALSGSIVRAFGRIASLYFAHLAFCHGECPRPRRGAFARPTVPRATSPRRRSPPRLPTAGAPGTGSREAWRTGRLSPLVRRACRSPR